MNMMSRDKELFTAGYKASGKAFYESEINEAWERHCARGIAQDNELTRHSPLADVINCMLKAYTEYSDNEYIYQEDMLNTNISLEEVEVIINLLSHSNLSAVDIDDD